ncbi:MAG: ribonuclease HII, partial [Kiritimatiellia bacterium]
RLNDSKQLTESQRRAFYDQLCQAGQVAIGIGCISAREIDRINVLQATYQAMRAALEHLPALPQHALIDGLPVPDLPCPATAIIKGDARSLSIAAASVIAKVTRDDIMLKLDEQYPEYGFARHKGYGTHAHVQALLRYGPCPEHRLSFRPVHETDAIRTRLKHPGMEPHVEENPRLPGRGATRRK